MILEYSLDYRSDSLVYEKIFLQTLSETNLKGTISKNHFDLKLYVEADTTQELEDFATKFATSLPHSIFLYDSDAKMCDSMPDEYQLPSQEKLPLPFCPNSLAKVKDENSANYYDIFTQCDACGYSIDGEHRSYKEEFASLAQDIKDGKIININTFYGNYNVGLLSHVPNGVEFDLVAYDLLTIEKYTNAKPHDITALGSFEKPLIKLKKKLKLTMDYENIEADLIRFKLADDFVLFLLLEELHKLDIDLIFITNDELTYDKSCHLVEPKQSYTPIEVVASSTHVVIVSGDKGLPTFVSQATKLNPSIGAMYSIIKEHKLNDENIAGIYLSRKFPTNILVHGEKYNTVEYLSINFEFESMSDVFSQIKAGGENGAKIFANYQKKNPELIQRLEGVVFEDTEFNIYKLWGIVSLVLGYSSDSDILKSAKVLEDSAMAFLGERGPRIDYKLKNIDGKVALDPLMTIRTAMSFSLAGVDQLMLSFGVIESFIEFLSNEVDELNQSMQTSAVTVAGSMLSNGMIFNKVCSEIAKNHSLYFNNQLPVDGRNILFGGVSLED